MSLAMQPSVANQLAQDAGLEPEGVQLEEEGNIPGRTRSFT